MFPACYPNLLDPGNTPAPSWRCGTFRWRRTPSCVILRGGLEGCLQGAAAAL